MPSSYEQRDPTTLCVGEGFSTRTQMCAVFGGTPYRGITYKANGDWVIAVSSPTGHDDWGYRDGWLDHAKTRYRYHGEWHGCGDMEMARGYLAVRDRSPRIFLFVREGGDFIFRGQFRVQGYNREAATRPKCKHQHAAIRFELARV